MADLFKGAHKIGSRGYMTGLFKGIHDRFAHFIGTHDRFVPGDT